MVLAKSLDNLVMQVYVAAGCHHNYLLPNVVVVELRWAGFLREHLHGVYAGPNNQKTTDLIKGSRAINKFFYLHAFCIHFNNIQEQNGR